MSNETLDLEKKENFSSDSPSRLLLELTKIKEDQKKISNDLKLIKRFIKWRQVWFVVQALIIAIPIILGIIFLPGYLKELIASLPDKLYY
ncbi:MAG: hypothetical protein JST_000574 [Candidatus Parcubacteria bacterium]|nr:MAG: hypothetical protein JST_5340 [Candidatus Parcubacteria bacterium]